MKRLMNWVMALVFVMPGLGLMAADMPAGDNMSKTLKGEVLDMTCYMNHEGKGAKHKDCAGKCIMGGSPMGLLATDGSVYLLVENHSDNKPYMGLKKKAGEMVEVTGDVYSRNGVQALMVKSAK